MEGLEIKNLRKHKGLTQSEFAKLIGVSLRSIQMYEKNKTKPSADILLKLLSLKQNTIISTESGQIEVQKIVDIIKIHYEKFESNIDFKKLLDLHSQKLLKDFIDNKKQPKT